MSHLFITYTENISLIIRALLSSRLPVADIVFLYCHYVGATQRAFIKQCFSTNDQRCQLRSASEDNEHLRALKNNNMIIQAKRVVHFFLAKTRDEFMKCLSLHIKWHKLSSRPVVVFCFMPSSRYVCYEQKHWVFMEHRWVLDVSQLFIYIFLHCIPPLTWSL